MVEYAQAEDKYKDALIDMWAACAEKAIFLRKKYLLNESDNELLSEFVSLLVEMFVQLEPKVEGTEGIDLEKYESVVSDPELLMQDPAKIWELYRELRGALEVLRITVFEKVS